MMVSLLSASSRTRKVGSSLVNRDSALDMLSWALESTGWTESEITGSGTYIEVMLILGPSPTKVSPVWQSIPKRPTMSPAVATSMSSILSACILTTRPILIFLRVRVWRTVSPLESEPW